MLLKICVRKNDETKTKRQNKIEIGVASQSHTPKANER